MIDKTTITVWIKALTCFVFAIALVLSVPSALQAASGMHSGMNAETNSYSHGVDSHTHDEMSAMTQHDMLVIAAPEAGDEKQSMVNGCSGICLSVEYSDTGALPANQVTGEKYLMLHALADSIVSSGILRPPQFLV